MNVRLVMTALDVVATLEETAGLVPSDKTGLTLTYLPAPEGEYWEVVIDGDFKSAWDEDAPPVHVTFTISE